jgi:hypothetical protein
MSLAPVEVGRLAKIQAAPRRYVERRVEQLDLTDDYHWDVRVTQQVRIPKHGPDGDAEERELFVPLGQFSKERMPDLAVAGPDGTILPQLSRTDRGRIAATLFVVRWRSHFAPLLWRPDRQAHEGLWDLIAYAVQRLAVAPRPLATRRIAELRSYLAEVRLDAPERELRILVGAIADEREFWAALASLAESSLLVARLRGVPGGVYPITITHSERFHYRGHRRASRAPRLREGLAWLGLIGFPIARSVANLGQAASLWIVQTVPEGVEALRCYWASDQETPTDSNEVWVEGSRAVASPRDGGRSGPDPLLLDFQLSPSTSIVATIGLAALLLVVSTYVYQALPDLRSAAADGDRTILVGLGSIFAAIPSAIAGGLAYRGQTFVRRASRGPRVLLAGLSAFAAFFAVVVSLKNLGDLAEATAYWLSIYSLLLIGLFAYIQLGPRWRKTRRSRRRGKTDPASPRHCADRQLRDALIWLALLGVGLILFARAQWALQEAHFFNHEFPINIFRTWWTWPGF